MSANGEPISKCPVCRYDLTAQTESCTCPKCGLPYGPDITFWVTTPIRWPFVLCVCLLFFVFALATIIELAKSGTMQSSDCITVLILASSCILTLVAIYNWPVCSFFAFNDKDIVNKSPFRSVRNYSWDELYFQDGWDIPTKITPRGPEALPFPSGLTRRSLQKEIVAELQNVWRQRTDSEELRQHSLSFCPQCTNCLSRFPLAHRCPECGFRFDSKTHVWWTQDTHQHVAVGMLAMSILLLQFVDRFATKGSGELLILFVFMVGVGGYIFAIRKQPRKRNFVAIGMEGLTLRYMIREARFFSWDELEIKSQPFAILHKTSRRHQPIVLPLIYPKIVLGGNPIQRMIREYWERANTDPGHIASGAANHASTEAEDTAP